jgi:hypothetical protein
MKSYCDFCDSPRINGMAIRKGTRFWMLEPDPNPADKDTKMACRECAKEKL